ncbi:MAG: ABC transporter substrate-binding protein [Bacteroidota bacterium]
MLQRLSPVVSVLLLFLLTFQLQSCRTDSQSSAEEVVAPEGPVTVSARLRGEPDRLSPYFTLRGFSRQVYRHIFPTLLDFNPSTMKLEPMLAKALPTIEPIEEGPHAGGFAFSMEIKEQAVWDDGSPVLASDYIFTLKMINNPKIGGVTAVYRDAMSFIRDVEVDPDNPKKFTILTSSYYIQADQAVGVWVYPEYAYDPDGLLRDIPLVDLTDPDKAAALAESNENLATFAERIQDPKYTTDKDYLISCGAYRLDEWEKGQRLVLKKKDNWWGNGLEKDAPLLSAYPEQITYKIMADQNTAVTMVRDEGFDILSSIPAGNFAELQESELVSKNYNFFTPFTTTYNYLGLNTNSPKLEDKRVRRALAHVFDADKVIEVVNQGYGKKMSNPIPDMYDFHDSSLAPIEFDAEKARTLLAEAGWEDSNGDGTVDKVVDGTPTEMILKYITTPGNTVGNNIALIYKEDAQKVGVTIELVTMEINKLMEARARGEFEMFSARSGLDPSSYDPYQLWHTASSSNRSGFGDAESDALIEELRTTLDKERRYALYKEFQQLLREEQPIILINLAQERILIHKKYKGATATVLTPGFHPHFYHY